MPEEKRPLKVFLCHASDDRTKVKTLYDRLVADGVDAWLDKEKLLPGQNWRYEIRKAVSEADVVIVCHSKSFNREGFRQREVRWALDAASEKPDGQIYIIPARLEECDVLESLREWHWVDLFEEEGYEMLMRALRTRAVEIGATLHIKKRRTTDVLMWSWKTEKLQETDSGKKKRQSRNSDISLTPLPRDKGQYASLMLHNNSLEETLYCRVVPKKILWLKEDPKEELPQWVDITDEINLENNPFSWHLGSASPEVEILPDDDKIANLAKFESSGDFAGCTTFTFYGREPSHASGKFRIQIDVLYRTNKIRSVRKKLITVCVDLIDSSRKGIIYELQIWECENDKAWVEEQSRKSVTKEKTGSEIAETPSPKKRTKNILSGLLDIKYLSAFIALIVLFFGNNIYEQITGHSVFATKPVPSVTSAVTFTLTPKPITPSQILKTTQPSKTPVITITPIKSFTPTTVPLPTEITDGKGVQMALVPAGEFTMGSTPDQASQALAECQKVSGYCEQSGFLREQPSHKVYLDAFYMDTYEVTNAKYKACVDSGSCTPPITPPYYKYHNGNIFSINYYGISQFNDYPVINVEWYQAKTYCEWRGGSLPTEAQWEKAARGTDGHTYPWGEEFSCNRVGCTDFQPHKVGRFESGKSPYGIYDLAGNVWEWVADLYDPNYYSISPYFNPLGPSSGQYRILRGGSWTSQDEGYLYRTSNRYWYRPSNDYEYDEIGFRCVRLP